MLRRLSFATRIVGELDSLAKLQTFDKFVTLKREKKKWSTRHGINWMYQIYSPRMEPARPSRLVSVMVKHRPIV